MSSLPLATQWLGRLTTFREGASQVRAIASESTAASLSDDRRSSFADLDKLS
jgi:hypothetical protein